MTENYICSWRCYFCWYLPQFGPCEASACVNFSQFGTRPTVLLPWRAPKYCSVQWTYLFDLHQRYKAEAKKRFRNAPVWARCRCNVCPVTCSVQQWGDPQTAAAVVELRRWCRSYLFPRREFPPPASRGSGSVWSPSSASPLGKKRAGRWDHVSLGLKASWQMQCEEEICNLWDSERCCGSNLMKYSRQEALNQSS